MLVRIQGDQSDRTKEAGRQRDALGVAGRLAEVGDFDGEGVVASFEKAGEIQLMGRCED